MADVQSAAHPGNLQRKPRIQQLAGVLVGVTRWQEPFTARASKPSRQSGTCCPLTFGRRSWPSSTRRRQPSRKPTNPDALPFPSPPLELPLARLHPALLRRLPLQRHHERPRQVAKGPRCRKGFEVHAQPAAREAGLHRAPKIQIGGPEAEVIPSTLFPQHEDRLVAFHHESLDVVKPGLQKVGDLTSRRVSDADLNDLWGMASHQSPGQKVVVFRDDSEAFVFRQPPDALVVVACKPDITNVTTTGKALRYGVKKTKRRILVDQRLHATDPRRRRSRSAANTKQARISSLVSSGKSARISASVMPEARYSRTSETVIRSPRIQGFPLRLPGSTVMRSSSSDAMASVYDGLPATAKPLTCCRLTSGLNSRHFAGIFRERKNHHQQASLALL